MHDHPPFLYGQVYGVVQPFTDLTGELHAQGEVWQFLGAVRAPDSVSLDVVGPDAVRKSFALDAATAARLASHVQLVPRLPWQYRPTCACETPQLQQVLGDPDCVALVCPACQFVFAAQPIEQEQLHVLPLDQAARAEVWEALTLDPEATLPEILATLLSVQVLPAVRVMAHKLGQRPDFGAELGGALHSQVAGERLPALAVAARLPVPHPAILGGVLDALRQPLDKSPTSDEAVLSMQAVFAHADALVGFRSIILAVRARVDGMGGARAALLDHLAGTVLDRMDAAQARAEQAFRQATGHLVQAMHDGGVAAVQAKVLELVPDGPYAEPQRAAVLEGAADALASADREAANALYGLAVERFQAFADQTGQDGQSLAPLADVERVRGKLTT